MHSLRIPLFFLFVFMIQNIGAQFYNGSNQEFGKNRIQFRKEWKWFYFRYQKFDTYYYQGGKSLAEYVGRVANDYLNELEVKYEFVIDDRLEFLIYNSQSEFKQSNIGLDEGEGASIGGVTRVIGSKVFLYNEGTREQLDKQIKSGIANVLIKQIMFGSKWREMLKGSSYGKLPSWYVDGFVYYASNGWDYKIDDITRDKILNKEYEKFFWFTGVEAAYAGAAVWNYIEKKYGKNALTNVLYMTRVSGSPKNGVLYVLGLDLDMLYFDMQAYYERIYNKDVKNRTTSDLKTFDLKTKKNRTYSNWSVNDVATHGVLVTNQMGQYKMFLYDLRDKKKKRIHKGEHKLERLIDHTFPTVKWHTVGNYFSYVLEHKGKIHLYSYDLATGKKYKKTLVGLQKVLDYNYSNDGKYAIFSAVKKGQTDLFLYNVRGNGLTQLTNDTYDELYPSFREGSTKVLFSSNRSDDSIRRKTYNLKRSNYLDLFVLDTENPKVLERVTNTPFVNETHGFTYKSGVSFLSDENGIINRYYGVKDSTIDYVDTAIHYRYFYKSVPLTNLDRNILELKINPKAEQISVLSKKDGKYSFQYGGYEYDKYLAPELLTPTVLKKKNKNKNVVNISGKNIKKPEIKEESKVYVDTSINYEKEIVEFTINENKGIALEKGADKSKEISDGFKLPEGNNYFVNFTTDKAMVRLDLQYLNATYQKFNPGTPQYQNPGVNGMSKWALSDLFEDYKLMAGFRLGFNLKDHEILLMLRDLSKRLDKEYVLYKGSQFTSFGGFYYKMHTYDLKYILKFPFSEVLALKGTVNYRLDQRVTLSLDDRSLQEPTRFDHLAGGKLELVFDDTRFKQLNILNGSRFKIWGEYYQQLNEKSSDIVILGADFRHYRKVFRNVVLAGRIAGSTSLGSRKLLYYMGGVDNWLAPKYNNETRIDFTQNYYFQTLATPIRGFYQNSRNGSSMAVANMELRIPLVSTFSRVPVSNQFINNFQLVGFFDAGLAWNGLDPYSENNSSNIKEINRGPLNISIESQKEPIIYGVGGGFRTKILGYFVRGDLAWGIDTGEVLKPMFHFSFGFDF